MKLKLIFLTLFLLVIGGCSSIAVNTNPLTTYDDAVVVEEALAEMNHQGRVFHYSANGTIATTNSVYFMGCTDSREVHFEDYSINAEFTPTILTFYENVNVSNNGTLVSSKNMNRKSALNSTMILYTSPTIVTKGDVMFTDGAIAAKSKEAAGLSRGIEWILASDTCYLFEVYNGHTGDNDFFANFFWSEEVTN